MSKVSKYQNSAGVGSTIGENLLHWIGASAVVRASKNLHKNGATFTSFLAKVAPNKNLFSTIQHQILHQKKYPQNIPYYSIFTSKIVKGAKLKSKKFPHKNLSFALKRMGNENKMTKKRLSLRQSYKSPFTHTLLRAYSSPDST